MRTKIFSISLLVAFLFTEIIAQNKTVYIDQKLSTGDRVGTLKKWEGSYWSNPFNPNTPFVFPLYSLQTILGDQSIYTSQKYNNWNSDFSNVKNHHPFTIAPTTDVLLSNFITTHTGVTIKTSLERTTATGGFIAFKDPWFIDYQDGSYANQLRNRGMTDAYPRQRLSPFYPNATAQFENGQTYRGVFKDQFFTSGTFYKVNIPLEQAITVHGQSRIFYFENWEASIINNQPSALFQDATLQETGIVFKDPNAVVTAKLKGQLMSNSTLGISSNSQRKMVRTDNGRYHIVYESNGNIYYTYSLT